METPENTDQIEEVVEPIQESPVKQAPKTLNGMLQAISALVTDGSISSAQAARFRSDLGITKSFFTKKQISPTERKRRRHEQRASRKANW